MGCIHLYMGKPNLGNLYFRKALRENENNRKIMNTEKSKKCVLFTFRSIFHFLYEIIKSRSYNLIFTRRLKYFMNK